MRVLKLTGALLLVMCGCHNTLMSTGLDAPDAAELENNRNFAWTRDSSGRVHAYFEATLAPAIGVARVARSLAFVDSALEIDGATHRINVFIVTSQDRMNALLGKRVDGRSFYQTGVAAVVLRDNWEANLKHELTHVVLGQRWGKASSQWISEGIATWIGNPFYGRDIRILARDGLLRTGRILPLAALERSFESSPDEIAYLESASIAQFVVKRFGVAALREIWQNGLSSLPRATGMSIEGFEREWRRSLDA